MKKILLTLAILAGAAGAHAANIPFLEKAENVQARLEWSSVTQVNVATNTRSANTTVIGFPDGEYRTVTENLATTTKYRAMVITQRASWASSSTVQGGLDLVNESTATWYAIYAVKVSSVALKDKFVTVGSTLNPVQSNFSLLNSRFGKNAWVYLGMIRNGDSMVKTEDILDFDQSGAKFMFVNTSTGNTANGGTGFVSSTTQSANVLTWTYSGGMGALQIPTNITLVTFDVCVGTVASGVNIVSDSAGVYRYVTQTNGATIWSNLFTDLSARKGIKVANNAGSVTKMDIQISGFIDDALQFEWVPRH